MKIVLDLSRLVREGTITPAERDRLLSLAERETDALAFSILIGFGGIAVSGGALALLPTATTAIALGALLMVAGLAIRTARPAWIVPGTMVLLVAALMFGGGLLVLMKGSVAAFLTVAAVLLVSAGVARSSLLIVLAVLVLSGSLGAWAGYTHALYAIGVARPFETIVLFSAVAAGAHLASKAVRDDWERLCIAAARTALLVVNFGFWVGSLWGDAPDGGTTTWLPAAAFAVVWALALAGVGLWGAWANRRWVVNAAAIFGAINFYTQWFEHLSATPLTVLLAGLLTLAAALALWKWNNRIRPAASRVGP